MADRSSTSSRCGERTNLRDIQQRLGVQMQPDRAALEIEIDQADPPLGLPPPPAPPSRKPPGSPATSPHAAGAANETEDLALMRWLPYARPRARPNRANDGQDIVVRDRLPADSRRPRAG